MADIECGQGIYGTAGAIVFPSFEMELPAGRYRVIDDTLYHILPGVPDAAE